MRLQFEYDDRDAFESILGNTLQEPDLLAQSICAAPRSRAIATWVYISTLMHITMLVHSVPVAPDWQGATGRHSVVYRVTIPQLC